MSRFRNLLIGSALASVALASPVLAQQLGLGRVALPEEVAAWDVAIMPDGRGLPVGQGSVEDGEEAFIAYCASCHGDFAEGRDNWPPLSGGNGSLRAERPLKTVGSYWPYLSTVWDYVNRSMPFGAALTLEPDEVYAITAYILYSNALVEDDFVLTNENFTEIEMPNAGGFYVDDRDTVEMPLFTAAPCVENCKTEVSITFRAADLNVTPVDESGNPVGTIPDFVTAAAAGAGDSVQQAAAEPEPEAEVAEVAAGPDPALVAAGERAFRQCAACHKVGEGARNGTGPVLNGVYGAAAGLVEGFRYSKQLEDAGKAGLVWDDATLDAFLADPKGTVPRNRMAFNGVRKEEDRAALIAYISTFAD